MKRLRTQVVLLVLGLSAPFGAVTLACCGPGSNFNPPPKNRTNSEVEVTDTIKRFRDDAVALQRRAELDLDEVTVQWVWIANDVEGATSSRPNLPLAEAEALAAKVYAQALAGDDFDKLVLTHSYGEMTKGQRPGMCTLLRGLGPDAVLTGGPNTFRREQQEPAVSAACWRLQPGEIGPVEHHEKESNSGYYIVRRLTSDEIKADNPANSAPANDAIRIMREDAAALLARPDHTEARVEVQHILIGRYFSEAGGEKKRLSPTEAEALAAEVYRRAKAGEDFNALVSSYTYDRAPGNYTMVADKKDSVGGAIWRQAMVPWFGDAAWKLGQGEVGVIVYDRVNSYYGYHIILRK